MCRLSLMQAVVDDLNMSGVFVNPSMCPMCHEMSANSFIGMVHSNLIFTLLHTWHFTQFVYVSEDGLETWRVLMTQAGVQRWYGRRAFHEAEWKDATVIYGFVRRGMWAANVWEHIVSKASAERKFSSSERINELQWFHVQTESMKVGVISVMGFTVSGQVELSSDRTCGHDS